MQLGRVALVTAAFVVGCATTPDSSFSDGSVSEAREFYAAYTTALRTHQRDALARFYRSDQALVIFNGARRVLTNSALDSIYRGPWNGPAFFAFDSLRFETISRSQVLVTGGFRWLPRESADTGRFVYLSILDRTAAGLKIRVEHETRLQPPAR